MTGVDHLRLAQYVAHAEEALCAEYHDASWPGCEDDRHVEGVALLTLLLDEHVVLHGCGTGDTSSPNYTGGIHHCPGASLLLALIPPSWRPPLIG